MKTAKDWLDEWPGDINGFATVTEDDILDIQQDSELSQCYVILGMLVNSNSSKSDFIKALSGYAIKLENGKKFRQERRWAATS